MPSLSASSRAEPCCTVVSIPSSSMERKSQYKAIRARSPQKAKASAPLWRLAAAPHWAGSLEPSPVEVRVPPLDWRPVPEQALVARLLPGTKILFCRPSQPLAFNCRKPWNSGASKAPDDLARVSCRIEDDETRAPTVH